jgi:DNA modification methylase
MGNNPNLADFMDQFGFLVDELFRITLPGRLCAVHCLDLMAAKWKEGEIELKNFSGEIVDAFRDRGWLYHSRVTIWKDPVIEMQRTKALGLLHKQLLKDSAMSRVGNAEYITVFRKPGANPKPIAHTREEYPVELWQKDASPVWMDVNQTRVLNGELARERSDERHICPLQLDVIERCMRLWSSKGDLVFSPFSGIGSEGYTAVKMGRRFIGSELKESYWRTACDYLRRAESESVDLFSLAANLA